MSMKSDYKLWLKFESYLIYSSEDENAEIIGLSKDAPVEAKEAYNLYQNRIRIYGKDGSMLVD